jgi:hypothetical protein
MLHYCGVKLEKSILRFMSIRVIIIMVFVASGVVLQGQNLDSILARSIAASVQLDSVVIAATRQGFEVEDFMRLVKEDESLHNAFHNLRRISCHFETQMQFKSKKKKVKAELSGNYNQQYDGRCRRLIDYQEVDTGNYYKGKSKKLRYYTSRMYDRVFVTREEVCDSDESSLNNAKNVDAIDSHTEELKKLIFSPGSKADVPFIGDKTALFSEEMWKYYDFSIKSDTFNGVLVYVFDASVKNEYVDKESKTVFKTLTTYFAKSDFQVLSRTYRLAYSTLIYMFDVTMHVDLVRIEGEYYPSFVQYRGTWNIPTKKRETGSFTINFDAFEKEY